MWFADRRIPGRDRAKPWPAHSIFCGVTRPISSFSRLSARALPACPCCRMPTAPGSNWRPTNHLRTGAPYWRHRTMSSLEMGNHLRSLHRSIMSEGISLHGALYYHRLLDYRAEERSALPDQQRGIAANSPIVSWMFDRLNKFVDSRLVDDVAASFPPETRRATGLVELR